MKSQIKALWQYRYFILSSIRSELKSRFIRSKLGGAWLILHPLAMATIYALILSQLLSAKLPGIDHVRAYPIYLLSGIVAWTLFSESLSRFSTLWIDNANYLKKINFPKASLVLITLGSLLFQHILLMIAIWIIFIFIGFWPSVAMFWWPLLAVLTLLFGASIGLILSVFNVFNRDVGQVLTIVMQFGFWLTPIVYTIAILPENFQHYFGYNPIYPLIQNFQQIIAYGQTPDLNKLLTYILIVILILIVSAILFKRAESDLVDEL